MNKTPAARALESGDVATRLPAPGPKRTRRYYAEKLGLEPIEEHPARTSLPRPKR